MSCLSGALPRAKALFFSITAALVSLPNPATSDCPSGQDHVPPTQITVVNMVPYIRSGESFEDCEPSLAVDPANPSHLVGTAFTPDPNNPNNPKELAPYYYSTDGGASWYLNPILYNGLLPGYNQTGTNDISVCFGGTSGDLYIAMIPAGLGGKMRVVVTKDFAAISNDPLPPLFDRDNGDQPHISAVTAWGGADPGSDLIYVTRKDGISVSGGKTSTLDRPSVDTPLRLEEGVNCNQDGPSVLSVPQLSGHVYAAFVRWLENCPPSTILSRRSDLIVLRDDAWAVGEDVFTGLLSGSSRGTPAVQGFFDLDGKLDNQSVISKVAMAVSSPLPGEEDKDKVYLAWGEGTTNTSYKLHLKRSTDSGGSWDPEIIFNFASESVSIPVPLATNPALAVNNRGVVGFLYQKLVGWTPSSPPGSGNWETHFMTMNEDLTFRSDDILAAVPNNAPLKNDVGPLGDYLQLVAVGKDFYGVFSSMNYPNCDYFPQGVTFQRNVDWTTNRLLDQQPLNGELPAEIPNSVDPYFFKYQTIPLEKDFYVRDWTKDATTADQGLEPSSKRNFYSTSDVWNRRSDQPGSFPNDQPENEDPRSGTGADGDNWAFARIRRNAQSTSGSQDVNVHFLISKFGSGSNFVDATSADPDVSFPATDPIVIFNAAEQGPIITQAYPWHLNVSASSHLCMAVEISSTPDDPYVPPSLRGNWPGWLLGTDLRIAYDNNKAQRNMGDLYMSKDLGADEGENSAGTSYYAIIHNAATFTRDVILRYEVPAELLQVLPRASIEVIGGRKTSLQPSKPIILKGMHPGENRWIGFNTGKPKSEKDSMKAPRGTLAPALPVYFYDMVGEVPANGFGIAVQQVPPATLYSENIRFHRSTFARPVLSKFPAIRETNLTRGVSEAEYLQILRTFLDDWGRYGPQVLDSLGIGDPFRLRDAAKELKQAVNSANGPAAATLHSAFMNRLDSYVTMLDLSTGDLADILQIVRWQEEIFESQGLTGLACPDSIVAASKVFIRDYSRRTIKESRYPDHVRSILPCLRRVAQNAPKHHRELLEACDRMERNLKEPRALQRAHRDYLLEFDRRKFTH